MFRASQVALVVKNLPASEGDIGDVGSIPESGRLSREGNGNPFQYSRLENPTDRGACGLQSIGSQRIGHDWKWLNKHTQYVQWDKLGGITETWICLGFCCMFILCALCTFSHVSLQAYLSFMNLIHPWYSQNPKGHLLSTISHVSGIYLICHLEP